MFLLTSCSEVCSWHARKSNTGEEVDAVNEALSSEVDALSPVLSEVLMAGDAGTRPNDFFATCLDRVIVGFSHSRRCRGTLRRYKLTSCSANEHGGSSTLACTTRFHAALHITGFLNDTKETSGDCEHRCCERFDVFDSGRIKMA